MSLYILTGVVLILVSVLITYLVMKSSIATKVAQLNAQLATEQQLRKDAQQKLAAIVGEHQAVLADFNETKRENAILDTKYMNAEALIKELKDQYGESTNRYHLLQNDLNNTLQQKSQNQAALESMTDRFRQQGQEFLLAKKEHEELRSRYETIKEDNSGLEAKYEENFKRLKEQQEFMDRANEKLKDAFHSLSAEALKNNNESFVTLAKSTLETQMTEAKGELEKKQQSIEALVKPLSESLGKFDSKIENLEKVRLEQHGQINQYILGVQQSTEKLQKETNSLVSALKTSHGRGRYGEIALRRVVEVAGMTEHCDFEEQVSVSDHEGTLRPDMIIRLPERKMIVVDSKVPLTAYMKAFETENEDEKKIHFIQHTAAVRDHLKQLSQKAYWSQFSESADYVVLYMQIESSFGMALQTDPTLVEDGIRNKVIFATPTTLITLLRTVGFVWQQVSIAENIEEIRSAGIELYNRTTVLLRHFSNMGKSLKTAVTHYNDAVASLESRFFPQAKKLYTLGSAYTKNTLPDNESIDLNVREVSASLKEISDERQHPPTDENNGAQ